MDISTPEGMEQAVAWQSRLFSRVKDGGVWLVPRSTTVITVNHSDKTAVFMGGMSDEPDIVKVIEAMGWTCIERKPEVYVDPVDPTQSFAV